MSSDRFWRVAITIAGSDSGGGAGIEADLKTFAALGVHGAVALTSVTAQNTYEVTAIHDIPPEVIYKQIKAVAEDMGINAGKTGMLSNSDVIHVVADAVREFPFPLVVDPVMVAKSGARLLREDAVKTLMKELLPLAKVVTPNALEAENLTGVKIRSVEDSKLAARKIVEDFGCEAAVVKGGHLSGEESVDVLYWRGRHYVLSRSRVVGCTHGTGCVFSAAIAAEIAKGLDIYESVRRAKEFVTEAIELGVRLGKGHCPVNPVAWLDVPAHKYHVLSNVEEALRELLRNSSKVAEIIPEVGMNLVMSMPPQYVRGVEDVAGISGRIVKFEDGVKIVGPVRFGASSHLARLVIEALRMDPGVRAALNIKFDEEFIKKAVELGYSAVFVDRLKEPEDVRRVEGSSLRWVVDEVFKTTGKIPDIIYDKGCLGKEAMIRILGRDALEVVRKLINIAEFRSATL